MIRDALSEFCEKYLESAAQDLKVQSISRLLLELWSSTDLMGTLRLGDFAGNFLFRSSAGIHQAWADVPWIALMDS